MAASPSEAVAADTRIRYRQQPSIREALAGLVVALALIPEAIPSTIIAGGSESQSLIFW